MGSGKINGSLVDNVARYALNGILAKSIEEKKEYGGMIYLLRGHYFAMLPRTQGDPTTVDVGTHEVNCGCPPGSTPIAYYHTHPTYSIAGMNAQYNELDEEDKRVAKDNSLEAAYLGTLDGSFFKFDCKQNKTFLLQGKLKNTK